MLGVLLPKKALSAPIVNMHVLWEFAFGDLCVLGAAWAAACAALVPFPSQGCSRTSAVTDQRNPAGMSMARYLVKHQAEAAEAMNRFGNHILECY